MSRHYDGAEVEVFEGADGSEVYLNIGQDYAFSRTYEADEIAELLAEFRAIQINWLVELLMRETDTVNSAGHPVIYVLGGRPRQVSRYSEVWHFTRLNLGPIPPEAWLLLRAAVSENQSVSMAVDRASVEDQRRFVRALMGDDVIRCAAFFKQSLVDALVYPQFEAMLSRSSSVPVFVAELEKCVEYESELLTEEERRVTRFRRKSMLPAALLLFLVQKGVMIRPVRPQLFPLDTMGFDELVLSEAARVSLASSLETLAAVRPAIDSAPSRNWHTKVLRLRRVFFILVSSSTVQAPNSLSAPLFERLFEKVDELFRREVADQLPTIFRAFRDRSPANKVLPSFRSRRRARGPKERFGWVRVPYEYSIRGRFPDSFVGPYEPKGSVICWADALEQAVTKVEVKNIGGFASTINLFLHWLVVSGNTSSGVDGLQRTEINDNVSKESSGCFRAFMLRRNVGHDVATSHMSRLSTLFDYMIADLPAPVANPVVMRFDAVKATVRRGKTPRRALGRDMLEYMREFNARDEFAFSKGRPAHYRTLYDRETKSYESVWFPAVARIVDLLLRLPLRGFQVRYLDTGEGDENVLDCSGEEPAVVRNLLPTATRGRRQGVLTLIDGLRGERILGLYVNTNKTSLEHEGGYEIPWCEEDLRDSIVDMTAWQRRWNPVNQPVMCVEKYRSPENPDVAGAVTMTYSLFRDPQETDGWPVSRDKIYRYWDDLCAAVEDELAAARKDGPRIRLTDWTEENKGRGRSERRRHARYDIHTLRVSGISALIEAGMPPDLVSKVAGHATIAMTLYYNVVAASALNHRLKEALFRVTNNLDDVDGLADGDFERIAGFLVNRRDEQDAVGLTMLRDGKGHGDGSFDVMSHGICPGGECASGGAYLNQAVGHAAVPRPLACSLCRYRLTGPMFLPGLVLNANRLMHELRRKGQEIAALNEERRRADIKQRRVNVINGRVESLYKEAAVIGEEWAAEVQYVYLSQDLLADYVAKVDGDGATGDGPLPVILGGTGRIEATARLESRSDFALLQKLADGVESWVGFRPMTALADHREFLNEVLAANGVEPFLLRLSGRERDAAARLLGRTIVELVPDDRIDDLRVGRNTLDAFPVVADALQLLRTEILRVAKVDPVDPSDFDMLLRAA